MLFNIGDKVVYPMHGAGIIEAIEKKEILGKEEDYYVMKIPERDMKVMFPIQKVEDIGIRNVIDKEESEKVFKELSLPPCEMTSNWSKRYKDNFDKIKSGNIFEVAKVVKTLAERDRLKGLSTQEKKLYASAKSILLSEMILANKGVSPSEMQAKIDNVISNSDAENGTV